MTPLAMAEELPVAIPTVLGNVDYRELKRKLERMDELLRCGIEYKFLKAYLTEWEAVGRTEAGKRGEAWRAPSAKQQEVLQRHAVVALRCNILRILLGSCYRDFSFILRKLPWRSGSAVCGVWGH